jgi:glycosyltransferase involved in cell wall biosynthesis
MRFLLGTVAHNQHVQNIARALHESDMLGEFRTGGVDVWRSGAARSVRDLAGRLYPAIESKLARRGITSIPQALVSADWRWEACRVAIKQVSVGSLLEDWFWEHSEHALDNYCAKKISGAGFDAFIGVEHGALRTLTRAKQLGKPGVVAFLSPHHATRARWVDSEYERFPEILTPAAKTLLEKGKFRDARRDEEANVASIIHCASRFTRGSLVAAGYPSQNIMLVPLGCPPVSDEGLNQRSRSNRVRFLYSGAASVHKGAHLLIEAWKKLKPASAAELHFFGVVALPGRCLENLGSGVFLHGPVSSQRIAQEYRASSVLVFPTLCDGFGMVIAEALSNGLPVVTTPNAGAADLVRENENGWVVPAGDSEALAERMQRCIDNPEMLEDMREPARATARGWTWAQFRTSFRCQLEYHLSRISSSGDATLANCDYSRS